LLESLENRGVIATGGGVLTKKENQEMLSNESYVFYLKGTLETLLRNIKNDPINIRPLANEKDEKALDSLLKSRLEAYEDVADVIISIDNYSVEEIVSFIKAEIKEMN
jgi:shikimate kinase